MVTFVPISDYRIATWTIDLPALQERRDDILLLARHFLKEASGSKHPPEIDDQVEQYLLSRAYPGNVRELRNLMYRIYSHCVDADRIFLGDIPPEEWLGWKGGNEMFLKEFTQTPVKLALENFIDVDWHLLEQIFKDVVFQTALDCANGSTKNAARRLKVNIRTVQNWRKDYREQFVYKKADGDK